MLINNHSPLLILYSFHNSLAFLVNVILNCSQVYMTVVLIFYHLYKINWIVYKLMECYVHFLTIKKTTQLPQRLLV